MVVAAGIRKNEMEVKIKLTEKREECDGDKDDDGKVAGECCSSSSSLLMVSGWQAAGGTARHGTARHSRQLEQHNR